MTRRPHRARSKGDLFFDIPVCPVRIEGVNNWILRFGNLLTSRGDKDEKDDEVVYIFTEVILSWFTVIASETGWSAVIFRIRNIHPYFDPTHILVCTSVYPRRDVAGIMVNTIKPTSPSAEGVNLRSGRLRDRDWHTPCNLFGTLLAT